MVLETDAMNLNLYYLFYANPSMSKQNVYTTWFITHNKRVSKIGIITLVLHLQKSYFFRGSYITCIASG